MAHSKQVQRASYPLPAYNFRVTIDGQSMSFAKVSGLQREHQTLTYRHGLSFLEGEQIIKYHIDKFESLKLERGSMIGATFLHEWLEQKDLRPLEVSLCDEQGKPVLGWRIAKALAVKLSASELSAAGNEVAIETLELKVAGISIVQLD